VSRCRGELVRPNRNPQGFGRNDGADVTAEHLRRVPNLSARVSALNEILLVSHLAVPQAQDVPYPPPDSWAGQNETNRYKKKIETKAAVWLSEPCPPVAGRE
jgi:hypothetical protein